MFWASLLLWAQVAQAQVTTEVLTPAQLQVLKKKPCVFVHAWATWCVPCLKELPGLLEVLQETKRVTPVVIDFSSAYIQDSVSKQWLKSLTPSLKTYLKTPIEDEKYMKAVDPEWNGVLPYSALYARGVRKQVWLGKDPTLQLKAAVNAHCH